ncbi:unnamed protein product [Lathyrus sativus]|nr:unnamed protein product [Lathyrus sativus]
MPHLKTIELYVRLDDEAYPTQSSYSHQYGVSQTTDEEIMQNNEPFIRDEEVGEYSDDELHDVHFEDLFDDGDEEDVFPVHSQVINAQPINLYNPPAHMSNICMESSQPIYIFENDKPNHTGENMEVGLVFENKEAFILFFTTLPY